MKKSAIAIALTLTLSSICFADGIPMGVVSSVTCQSGATVNFAETVSPGQILSPDALNLDRAWGLKTLTVPMIHDGNEYRSGQPPCPKGDTLIITLRQPVIK